MAQAGNQFPQKVGKMGKPRRRKYIPATEANIEALVAKTPKPKTRAEMTLQDLADELNKTLDANPNDATLSHLGRAFVRSVSTTSSGPFEPKILFWKPNPGWYTYLARFIDCPLNTPLEERGYAWKLDFFFDPTEPRISGPAPGWGPDRIQTDYGEVFWIAVSNSNININLAQEARVD